MLDTGLRAGKGSGSLVGMASATRDQLPTAARLLNRQAPPENIQMSLAARALAAVAADPKVEWRVDEMAKASGLTEFEVEAIFGQPWFVQHLQERALAASARLNLLAIETISDLMLNSQNENTRLAAAKSCLQAYKILTESIPRQEDDDAKKILREQMESFKAARGVLLKNEENDEGKRPVPARHAAPRADRDQGRDPDRAQ